MMLICFLFFILLCFFSSRRRHTMCALVTGVQTCALPISASGFSAAAASSTARSRRALRISVRSGCTSIPGCAATHSVIGIIGEQTIAPAFGIELGAFACAPVRGAFDTQRVRIGFAQDLADVLALSPPRLVRRDLAPDTQAVEIGSAHVDDIELREIGRAHV